MKISVIYIGDKVIDNCESCCGWFLPFIMEANAQVQLEAREKWGCTIFPFKFMDHLKSVHKPQVRNRGLVPHSFAPLRCYLP